MIASLRRHLDRIAIAACLLAVFGGAAYAQESTVAVPSRLSMDDAWWTGPLLAATASTLPAGHLYFEPYLYDMMPYAHFDSRGHAHAVARENELGSLSYVNYGLTDRFTVGMIPRFGYDWVALGGSSTGIGAGDLTFQGQYRLTLFQPGDWVPTLSINVQETLPTGRFDRLERTSDGFGSGAHSTTISLFSQSYFWMPNGRILRSRLNVSYAFSDRVAVDGASVYGTRSGFSGYAIPGDSLYGDLAFEYSMTRSWVAALDLWYEHDGSTGIFGAYPKSATAPAFVAVASGNGVEGIVAPALEYNWSARFGIIIGARVIVAGRNETATAAPVAAVSCFF